MNEPVTRSYGAEGSLLPPTADDEERGLGGRGERDAPKRGVAAPTPTELMASVQLLKGYLRVARSNSRHQMCSSIGIGTSRGL